MYYFWKAIKHFIICFVGKNTVNYTTGLKDLCTIFFYSLCWIVVHAVIQEYILDVRYHLLLYFFLS